MGTAHAESFDRPDAGSSQAKSGLRAASMSALEEALRRALESASREEVIQRIMSALPAQSPQPIQSAQSAQPTEAKPAPGLHGKVQKVSVSLPTELTNAVRARTGAGAFSRYVTEAVQERMRLDLLDDLSAELAAEFGPVDNELVKQAMTEWPDYQHD